jgi:hypothetical protein
MTRYGIKPKRLVMLSMTIIIHNIDGKEIYWRSRLMRTARIRTKKKININSKIVPKFLDSLPDAAPILLLSSILDSAPRRTSPVGVTAPWADEPLFNPCSAPFCGDSIVDRADVGAADKSRLLVRLSIKAFVGVGVRVFVFVGLGVRVCVAVLEGVIVAIKGVTVSPSRIVAVGIAGC